MFVIGRLTLTVPFRLSLQKFPFDTQSISIQIESCEYNLLQLRCTTDQYEYDIELSQQITNGQRNECKIIVVYTHTSVALLIASQYALPGYGDRRVWVRGPSWPNHCVRL